MNLNIETIFHSIEDYYNQFIILFEMLTLSDESNDGNGKMMNNRP